MIFFRYFKTAPNYNYDCCQTENQYFRRRKKLQKDGYKVEICESKKK